jgi:hemerythrin
VADKNYMFDWSARYSVGVGSVDAQHQNLFAMANELHLAMVTGQSKAALSRTLDRLIQYTTVHFAHEERLMRLYDYPEVAAHCAEHEALRKQVVKFQEEFAAGRVTITVRLLMFLRDWLQNHIAGSDLKLAPYLKERAVA